MREEYTGLTETQAIAAFIQTARFRGIRVKSFSLTREGSTLILRVTQKG